MLEATVRAAVTSRIASECARHGETRIVHELALCQAQARIDLAAINGRLVGWEIKTRSDTLVRLPRQQEVYSRVFDRVWLVADERHLDRAMTLIPAWWGMLRILDVRGECRLTAVRGSHLNPDVDLHALVRLLWRQEAIEELATLGIDKGFERSPRKVLWDRLAMSVPRYATKTQLQERVRERLKHREGWRVGESRTSDGGSS